MRSVPLAPEVERAAALTPTAGGPTAAPAPASEVASPASPADIALVDALGRGEPWAAQEVWDRHAGSVRRLLARALGPRPEVDDLTQEVFMRVFTRIGMLRNAGALREFVIAVAVNALKRELRRRWVRRRVFLSDSGTMPDVEGPSSNPEAREALARCYAILDKLGARERAAFVLRYMEERTLEEVAAALAVSLSTAKRLVNRSSERVSKHVGSDQGLRNYFERRESAVEQPRLASNNPRSTSTKSNVTE